MNINKIIKIILSIRDILLNTKDKWLKIESSKILSSRIYLEYALPIYIFSAMLSFIGAYFNSYTWYFCILKMISVFTSLSLGVFMSATLIQYIAPKKLKSKHKTQYFKLVIYSVTILAIFKGIGNLFPPFSFFKQITLLGELYFIRIFWLGIEPMLQLKENKKISFLIISCLIISVSIMMTEKIINMIFNIPILSI